MGYSLPYYIVPSIILLILIRKYRESKWGKCRNQVLLNKKVAIITGANSGLGFEVTKELASRDAEVILACRTFEKAELTCIHISELLDNSPKLVPMELDLASLKSIKHFADEVKRKYNKIHLLINNAGVSYPSKMTAQTSDGFEIHMGVNHLGHFYLTQQLLDLLSESSRVVVVASSLHERGEINLSDLNSFAAKKTNLYANSKLANIYFAQELARRTKKEKIKVYACCPGWVYTGLFRHYMRWFHFILVAPLAFFFMRSPKQGAQTIIYCATEPSLENETGLLYKDCRYYNRRTIFFDNIAKQLWEVSEKMIEDALKKSDVQV
nr:retinol dehydrogenase 11-like [Leptinotarsa decemlineata]